MSRFDSNIMTLFVLLAALASQGAYCQAARPGSNANAQLMQQIQQLGSERTRLQAENTQLKKDLEDARKDRDTLKSGQQAVAGRAQSSETALQSSLAQRTATDKELTQTNDKLQQLKSKYQELLQNLQAVETERTTTRQTLTSREQDLTVCIDRNLTLYEASQEAVARLEQHTASTRVSPSQLEGLIDDYKGRVPAKGTDPSSNRAGPGAPSVAPHQSPPTTTGARSATPQPAPATASPATPTSNPTSIYGYALR
jgi:uncharacterized phage infection (PIP) family protein YhgE